MKLLQSNIRYKYNCWQYLGNRYTQQDAGFSLIEVIAVVVMIGILAAIALPSWSAFVNRQRLNKANDAVLAAIQQAQKEAKKTKLEYIASFRINNNILQSAVYPSNATTTDNYWQKLGGDLQIPEGTISVSTNMSSKNTVGTPTLAVPLISFDYMGTVPNANFSTSGLKIVLTSSRAGGLKRCVIVNSLLGATLTKKDTDCN